MTITVRIGRWLLLGVTVLRRDPEPQLDAEETAPSTTELTVIGAEVADPAGEWQPEPFGFARGQR